MKFLFNEILYRPMLNLLFFLYNNIWADLGVAIILLTLIIRFVLLPVFYKSAKDQTIMQKIAPKIKEIQETHKHDKEKQVKEIMNIYKEHKVNPFSGFALLFIQLPFLIALYQVFLRGLGSNLSDFLYSFVAVPSQINYHFLGLIQLNQKNIALVLIASVFQYLQTYLLMKVAKKNNADKKPEGGINDIAQRMGKQMMYIGPVFTFLILYSLPSAVALYWVTTSVFSVVQQIFINKSIEKNGQDIPKIANAN